MASRTREVVFRAMAGFVASLFLFGAVLMARQEFDPGIVVIVGLGLFFAAYAALGEYKIRGLLRLLGAKDNSSQRSGGGKRDGRHGAGPGAESGQ